MALTAPVGDPHRQQAAIRSIPSDWAAAIGPAASPEGLAPIADFVAAQQTPAGPTLDGSLTPVRLW